MLEEKRNNKPDVVLKKYWENKERFSDFFNAVLFDGKTVIRPEELEDLDTDESSILEHKNYAETLKASRDNIAILQEIYQIWDQFCDAWDGESGTYSLRNAYENNGL